MDLWNRQSCLLDQRKTESSRPGKTARIPSGLLLSALITLGAELLNKAHCYLSCLLFHKIKQVLINACCVVVVVATLWWMTTTTQCLSPPRPHTSGLLTLTLADTYPDVTAVTFVWNWFLLRWFSCTFMAPRRRRRLFGLMASASLSTPTPLRPKDGALLQSLKMLHQYILLNDPYFYFIYFYFSLRTSPGGKHKEFPAGSYLIHYFWLPCFFPVF